MRRALTTLGLVLGAFAGLTCHDARIGQMVRVAGDRISDAGRTMMGDGGVPDALAQTGRVLRADCDEEFVVDDIDGRVTTTRYATFTGLDLSVSALPRITAVLCDFENDTGTPPALDCASGSTCTGTRRQHRCAPAPYTYDDGILSVQCGYRSTQASGSEFGFHWRNAYLRIDP